MNAKSKLAEPARSLSSLVRPHYSPGLLLQDDDLTQAVSYTRELSRLMFRTLFGCGVLCGLRVGTPTLDKCGKLHAIVAKGVALDCMGDPIEVRDPQDLTIDPCEVDIPDCLWFAVRRIEKCCAPRAAICSPDDDEPPSVCTRERDGFEIRVFPARPDCSCGCDPLPPPPPPVQEPPPPPPAEEPPILLSVTGTDTQDAKKQKAAPKKTVAKESKVPTHTDKEAAHLQVLHAQALGHGGGPDPCLCTDRTDDCYKKHYDGECPCDCCDCEWIILAKACRDDAQAPWIMDHSVRRFVRPVLMRDPVVEQERNPTV